MLKIKQPQIQFLGTPAEIRKAIAGLSEKAESLDLAVAFIGPEWHRLLAHYSGAMRVVCWLRHPATHPDAVKLLMSRNSTMVKQRDGLHTKVYLAPGMGAIVGSANLSQHALSELVDAPQSEAAVMTLDPKLIARISTWFRVIWNDYPRTCGITDANLQQAREDRKKFPLLQPHTINRVPPPPDHLPKWMMQMGKTVAKIPLNQKFTKQRMLIRSLASKKSLSSSDVGELLDTLAKWTKHRAVYRNLERNSRKKTLVGLRMLDDESRDVYDRLTQIKGKKLLRGLQIPAMSVLLYWLRPEAYLPYNAKTREFLEDTKMHYPGMSASSPACYQTWLAFAEDLRARLHLPMVGHVDRLVTRYYDGKKKSHA
jgi:hypothetical protein